MELDCIISLMDKQSDLHIKNNTFKQKSNISLQEHLILKLLRNKPNLHFTEADKGGALVILDYSFYSKRIREEHLSDISTYEKVNNYDPRNTLTEITSLCQQYRSNLTKKEYDFLTKFRSITPHMYGLPKLHKTTTFSNLKSDQHGCLSITAPQDLKFRPIISSRFAPTSHLSSLLDVILKPFLSRLNSYCRDTFHFLETLPRIMDDDYILMSFDVVSLYTSIPHKLGYQAIEFWLEKHNDMIPTRFEKSFILCSLKLVLERNYFSFEDDFYVQKAGTAMGTKVAPTYASLVMGFLENNLYLKFKELYPSAADDIQKCWLRYLDDCWLIWKKRYGDHKLLLFTLNSLNPSIKFTSESNASCLNFLDVMVYIDLESKTLKTDIYRKPTDTMSYVPFNSAHPRHILKNIPYNLIFRIKRIVSDQHKRNIRYLEIKDKLIQLKYPLTLINDAIRKAESVNRGPTNNTTSNVISTKIPYIETFNKNNPNTFRDIIKPITYTLKTLDSFRDCIFNRTYRQPRSLISILSRKNRKTFVGIKTCNQARCKCCNILITGTEIKFNTSIGTKIFKIKNNFNCLSSNVIYFLKCGGCDQFYVGQTGDIFRNRMTVHRQQINDSNLSFLKVSKHIASCGKVFTAAPFYQMPPDATRLNRETKEQLFIDFFSPPLNSV